MPQWYQDSSQASNCVKDSQNIKVGIEASNYYIDTITPNRLKFAVNFDLFPS